MQGTGRPQRGPDAPVRLFENDVLESLTHMHPATPWFIGVPVVGAMVPWAFIEGIQVPHFFGLFLLGLLGWTLIEYVVHRFAFHYEPRTRWGKRVHFLAHGIHHDYPDDASRLVMPPVLSIPFATLVFFLLLYAFSVPVAPAVFAGVITGYVAYDTLHYMAHHRPMKSRIGRALKRYHMHHHFADTHGGYGVSSPLWDYVFRTHPEVVKRREEGSSAQSGSKRRRRRPSDRLRPHSR